MRIALLPTTKATDRATIGAITALVNEVYAEAEKGLWQQDADRTNAEEISEYARAGQLAVARLGGRIVGCVRIQRLGEGLGEFGMLAAAPAERGKGIGGELVRFAEAQARAGGLATMQLELLVPRDWTHPAKAFLASWYGRIGYVVTRTSRFEQSYPQLAAQLATPCDFLIYHRDLRSGSA